MLVDVKKRMEFSFVTHHTHNAHFCILLYQDGYAKSIRLTTPSPIGIMPIWVGRNLSNWSSKTMPGRAKPVQAKLPTIRLSGSWYHRHFLLNHHRLLPQKRCRHYSLVLRPCRIRRGSWNVVCSQICSYLVTHWPIISGHYFGLPYHAQNYPSSYWIGQVFSWCSQNVDDEVVVVRNGMGRNQPLVDSYRK